MKLKIFILSLIFLSLTHCKIFSNDFINPDKQSKSKGAFYSQYYPNLFVELLSKKEDEVRLKIDNAFQKLFYGDNNTERVYYPADSDMAYIKDIWNDDIRTEGMSYGMMIAVQLNKKEEFDKLWKWAKTYMQHKSGQRENYFAWHCKDNGEKLDSNSASDGEEWFVTALLFASARWGDGEGIFNYKNEAQKILDAMLSKTDSSDKRNVVTNMFNKKEKQVVFVPAGEADDFTDPSYHLPHFYEIWANLSNTNNQFWCDAAKVSREFWKKTVHPETGLAPDYANFDGTPFDPWYGGHKNFQYDAWRVAMNIAVDYIWFGKDKWAIEQSNRLLKFFYSLGIKDYPNLYTLDGKPLSKERSPGLIAMNAVAALASTENIRKDFVEELWNLPVPSGRGRYYDGMLYMLALLQVSGNFKIYLPDGINKNFCE